MACVGALRTFGAPAPLTLGVRPLRMKRSYIIAAVLSAHLLPVAAWAMVKPLRVVAPELVGLSCTTDNICTDDLSRVAEARALLNSANEFVAQDLGKIQALPKAVFCSTDRCSAKFGLGKSVAFSVATVGVIFSERAWQPFYVRHELIHHLQNERLGTLTSWLFKPTWFIEGMAYARSQDPRQPLPEPLEAWRRQYQLWEQKVGKENLWDAAAHVRNDN